MSQAASAPAGIHSALNAAQESFPPAPQISSKVDQMALINKRNAWKLLPIIFLGGVVATLDKANLSVAALEMNKAIGLSPAAFGFGAGIFFLTYTLMEVPSNLVLQRVGARRWLGILLVAFGLASMATSLATDAKSFYGIRLAIGAAEAGWFPGVLFYLSRWFTKAARGRAVMLFLLAVPISVIIGNPISGAILTMAPIHGIVGWQWVFISEGIPSILLGLYTMRVFRDGPEDAAWLSVEDRRLLTETLARERLESTAVRSTHANDARQRMQLALLSVLGLMNGLAVYGVFVWLPRVIKDLGNLSHVEVGLLSALPFVLSAAALVISSVTSDRLGDRVWHVCAMFAFGGLALAASTLGLGPVAAMTCLLLAVVGIFGAQGVFFAMIVETLGSGTGKISAATGVAIVMSLANCSGLIGPYSVGLLLTAFGNFKVALLSIAAVCLLLSTVASMNRRYLAK